jgi:hypothetical protein
MAAMASLLDSAAARREVCVVVVWERARRWATAEGC